VEIEPFGFKATFGSRQAHSGESGLDLPAIGEAASDEEVVDALNKVGKAQDRLEGLKLALVEDTTTATNRFEVEVSIYKKHFEKILDLSAQHAEDKSLELKNDLQEGRFEQLTQNVKEQLSFLLG